VLKKDIIIIPTYNEKLNIRLIYDRIRNNNSTSEILFIDDNSPDGTSQEIKKLINVDSKVHILSRENKLGIGSAHKTGFEWAFKKKYNIITTIDADLSHEPELIPSMIERLKNNDIIITGRFLRKDTLEEWPLIRRLITNIRHKVVKFLLGVPFDTSGAFRSYNIDKVNLEDLLLAKDNGYSFFWESLYFLYKKNYKILEIPMRQPRRIHGASKIKFKDILRAVTYLLYFFFKEKFK
tara:strand:+ start:1535 stop:2245 length:711 start_codon:yes stop_codon:yes gene_type:complete